MNQILLVKKIIKKFLAFFSLQDNFLNYIRNKKRVILYNGISYKFSSPNKVCDSRAKTLATKEPETLNWIDSFSVDSVFWDIGANIGIYSVYAAKSKGCIVYSFEPSVFNLEVLARNVFLNKLNDNVTILPLAVNDRMGKGDLNMSSIEIGGALSTFDKFFDDNGEKFNILFNYPIFSISIDQIISKLKLKSPDYIKIDVDGIELLILRGGMKTLKNIKGLLIELTNEWSERKLECEKLLISSGLKNVTNKYSNSLTLSIRINKNCANQIWEREN